MRVVSGARLECAAPPRVLLLLGAALLGQLQDARTRHLHGQVQERVGVAGPGRERGQASGLGTGVGMRLGLELGPRRAAGAGG